MFIKRFPPPNYFCLLFLALFLVTSCHQKQNTHQTDLDNLYALKRTPAQKDSISKKHEAAVSALLQSPTVLPQQAHLDSLIKQLRWSNNEKSFFALVRLAETAAKKQRNDNRLANLYEDIAVFYHDEQKLDSAYAYYLKSEVLYGKNGDSLALAENIFYQSRLLYEAGFSKESENKLYQALKLLKNTPDSPIYIEANQLKTFYSTDYSQYEDALQTLFETYKELKKDEGQYKVLPIEKYKPAIANLLGNIALFYLDLNQYEQAEKYALEGLSYYNKNVDTNQLYAHLSTTYYLALYHQGKNKDIIDSLIECYTIYTRLNHPYYLVESCLVISGVYLDLNQSEKSLAWLKKAYDLADKNNLLKQKRDIIEQILLYHKEQQSSEYITELIELSNLLENTKAETRGAFAKIEYNSFLLEQENKALKQRLYLFYMGAFIVIGSLLFFIIWIRLRNKNKDLVHTNTNKSKNEQILNLLIENNTIENITIVKERNRIAKDLHDGIINSIFTLRFNAQLLEISNEKLKDMLVDELSQLENKVRDISHSFALQSAFRNKSFENLLTELVNKQSNRNKTSFSITFEKNLYLEQLSTLQKVNIYQIIQEAFQNVNKHAKASQCNLKITKGENCLVVRVKDNGVGIQKSTTRGIGINNMKERAQLINTDLKIVSNPNKGTQIILFIAY
ncbi:ATP-binding protein [Myroides odoratus]|uniref:tetratricopeptide repeat-containing sensor histidine kinase n=1 Tax=Myroides odoratus TaxID=256 RepID=UPI0039AF8679